MLHVPSAYVLKCKEKWKRKYNCLEVIKDSVRPTAFAAKSQLKG